MISPSNFGRKTSTASKDIVTDAMERVPLMATTGVSSVINGPIPYAPDGLPLIGPMPGVDNAFEACVFTFGIAQGGGAGKVMAEWIVDGATEWDMWAVDPRRYTDYTDHEYCVAKGMEVYGNEYAMHFPMASLARRPRPQAVCRPRTRQSPRRQMGDYNGWERANWFAQDGDDTSEEATHTWARSGPWEQRIREECEAVRDGCGVLAITGFTRLKVEGPGAREFVDGLTASRLPNDGRIGLIYFANDRGRIVTEMSCMVHGDDDVGLITAATAQWHDAEHLWRNAPDGITVTDHTKEVECLLLTGPKARDILDPLTNGDLSRGWLTTQLDTKVAGKDCALLRVSFAGELGWELHCAMDDAPAIWDAVIGAGATPFGMYALNSLRIEKGYRAWKGDLSTDYTLLQGGLDRFVKLDKPQDFPGKAATLAEKQQGVTKRFASLIVEAGDQDAPYMSTIWHDGEVVGETTSGAYGHRVGASIALGMIRADLAAEGTEVEIDIFGQRCRAVVQADQPLWDPKNERIRA